MGTITSRMNINSLHPSRRRSQLDEPFYSYSLNKNYFSNYFFMGGERFEVNDPDYLFGDNCDLNFLSCTKPYSLPYKRAQQNLLSNLNTKQKANNKVSSRVNVSLTSPLNILTGRHRPLSQGQKQDAQTQTLSNSGKGLSNGPEPSQPLVMLINIRKETLRLVKSSNFFNIDSDPNSLSNTLSPVQTASMTVASPSDKLHKSSVRTSVEKSSLESKSLRQTLSASVINNNRLSSGGSQTTTTATVHLDEMVMNEGSKQLQTKHRAGFYKKKHLCDSDTTSNVSTPPSTGPSAGDADDSSSDGESSKSGYTSVKDVLPSSTSDDEDENFEDALNDATNPSSGKDEPDEDESERAQQHKSLLRDETTVTKENSDVRIPNELELGREDLDSISYDDDSSVRITHLSRRKDGSGGVFYTKRSSGKAQTHKGSAKGGKRVQERIFPVDNEHLSNRVYNIEFQFDTEVDCSIRIYYFCTREVNANGVHYIPQHATYKSKSYVYKKGLHQKFVQQEHTFQPYLFDEDLLIYKPLDVEGKYNSGAVFPIVIHCVALDGPQPRQSQSLVATVEKSQLDESYSIKPLKQLIFVDGVQYILQDIYGIENKHFRQPPQPVKIPRTLATKPTAKKNLDRPANLNSSLRSSMVSIGSNELQQFSDTASIASGLIIDGDILNENDDKDDADEEENLQGSLVSIATTNHLFKSLNSDSNSYECVICMSEERDTMLLPCRHLCLCSSCAQSLRYQANSCPICRCPFKAALNFRVIQFNINKRRRYRRRFEHNLEKDQQQQQKRRSNQTTSISQQQKRGSWSTTATVGSSNRRATADHGNEQTTTKTSNMHVGERSPSDQLNQKSIVLMRRESETCSATPLLSRSPRNTDSVVVNVGGGLNVTSQPSPIAGESQCAAEQLSSSSQVTANTTTD